MKPSNLKLVEALKNPKLKTKLLKFAESKLAQYSSTNRNIAMSAEDLVQQAIVATLSEDRPWREERCPELFAHLAGCIKSILYNQSNHKAANNLSFDLLYENTYFQDQKLSIEDYLAVQNGINKCLDLIKTYAPELLPHAVERLKRGVLDRSELAKYLNISLNEVDNQQAKMKRLLKKHANDII